MHKFIPIMYKLRLPKCKIIVVDGNIGVGKSTSINLIIQWLISEMKKEGKVVETRTIDEIDVLELEYKGIQVRIVLEPTTKWLENMVIPPGYIPYSKDSHLGYNILDTFYQDVERNAFTFQVNAFCTRVDSIYEQLYPFIESQESVIIITERSVISDKYAFVMSLVQQGLFRDVDIVVYDHFYNLVASPIEDLVEVIIALQVTVDEAMARATRRDRKEERSISIDYMICLHECYETMYKMLNDTKKVIKVDWNPRLEQYPEMVEMLYTHVRQALDICIDTLTFTS